ncbi:MAG TPA: hypothetical protein VI363_01500 [Burkholderiales bacterium]
MRRPIRVLVAASIASALAACQAPMPTAAELAALDYGPRPANYEQIVRDYLKTRLAEPEFAIVEFKTEPKPLHQKEAVLGDRQYGWAACLMISDKDRRGAYEEFHPMVPYVRNGKVVAANGDGLEQSLGLPYARSQCRELGYEVP